MKVDKVSEIRKQQVDEIDEKIVELLAKRMRASSVIGKIKRTLGKNAVDKAREEQVFEKARGLAKAKGLPKEFVEQVFKQILAESLRSQEEAKAVVAFQGELGAFSEEAAYSAFTGCVPLACKTFDGVLEAVEQGEADFALLPIENSTEGIVGAVHDLLVETKLSAVAEVLLRVNLCLLALPGQQLAQISEVYSHPQALAQAIKFLSTSLPAAKQIPFYDTAGAAEMIAASKREGAAAIAGSAAAKHYGLQVLAKNVEDSGSNFTRFLAFAKKPEENAKREKTSIAVKLENKPGTLAEVIGTLAGNGINITRVESRPLKERPWEYIFFIDFEADAERGSGKKALEELRGCTQAVKVFGSYAKAVLR